MKRNGVIAAGVVLVFSCLSASKSPGQIASETQDSQQDVAQLVSVLDHVWLDAARNHDTGTMAWVFSDHFIELHNGGNAVSKAKQIDQIRSSTTNLTELYPSDIQVRYISPNVAILTDTTNIQGTRDGQNIGGKYHVLRVFNKENGRWRAAAAGLTLIGPQPASTGKPETAPGAPSGILSQGIQGAAAEQVAELDRQWLHAALTRNTDYMAALFSDDFVEIHPGGEIVTKQQQIDQIKSSTHKMTELRPVDIHVHYLSSDLAILTDTTVKKGSSQGINQTGNFRVLRIFVKQNGKWRAAGAAQTPIATGIMVTGNG